MSNLLVDIDRRTQMVGHNRMELLLFRLRDNQRFGINVFKVQEVIKCPKLTVIPHSNIAIAGVATMRGKTISLMDLGMAVGYPPVTRKENCYVIEVANCEVLQAIEKFQVESILDAKARRLSLKSN